MLALSYWEEIIDTGQRQRALAISDLMRRAKAALDENTDAANGIALSLLHDAIEHTLYLVLLGGHQALKKGEEFKELISSVAKLYSSTANKDMPFQRQLTDLNGLRVAYKHRGARPSRVSTLEAYCNGHAFLETLFKDLYAIEIDSFDLIDQLRNTELRERLVKARDFLRAGQFDDGMCEVAVANYRLDQAFGAVFDQPKAPLRLSSPFGDDASERRDVVEFISRGDRHTLVTAVLIASGQNISAHTTMRRHLPVVYHMLNDEFRFDKITPVPYTAEQVEMCLAQVSKIAVWMEERFPALEFSNGRWITGVVSPWPD
ncbi:MAG: hypothetical protein WCA81_15640 [Rhizomicrobium sp.]